MIDLKFQFDMSYKNHVLADLTLINNIITEKEMVQTLRERCKVCKNEIIQKLIFLWL